MTFLRILGNPRLFAADDSTGRLYLVLPEAYTAEPFIKVEEAWTNPALLADFVYTSGDPGLDQGNAESFVVAVLGRVRAHGSAPRGFVWLADPTAWRNRPLDAVNAPMMAMNAEATGTPAEPLALPILPGVHLVLNGSATLALRAVGTSYSVAVSTKIDFAGPCAPGGLPAATSAVLALGGARTGMLDFTIFLGARTLLDASSWGFQFVHPIAESLSPAYQWLPLAEIDPVGSIGFEALIDPSDPANSSSVGATPAHESARSRLAFTGLNGNGAKTQLITGFRTKQGTGILLIPVVDPTSATGAALVFNAGPPTDTGSPRLQLAPSGDFVLTVAGSPESADLLCGLQGTEVISFRPDRPGRGGDRIRFTAYQPAYAARYPFAPVSPVAAPIDTTAPLLDATYTTSWATIIDSNGSASPGITYVAQPKGAALYGVTSVQHAETTRLMTWQTPAYQARAGAAFPLAPYAGRLPGNGFPAAETTDFEREVIAPTRRALAGPPLVFPDVPGSTSTRTGTRIGAKATAGEYNTVTSSGLLATVGADGRWTRILLGQTTQPNLVFYFDNPEPALQQAFQDGQVLLIAANGDHLGRPYRGDGNFAGSAPLFANTVEIGGWSLAANVGGANRYNDYRNILIVKGRKGKLYDPLLPANSLVANPQRWTQHETFASPSDLVPNPEPQPQPESRPGQGANSGRPAKEVPGAPDPRELTVFSRWLQDYFAAARLSEDPALDRFNTIAADENWTGVLVLRMDVAKVPDDLLGIMAGVADPAAFNAHHLGIEVSQVTLGDGAKTPQVIGASSMFGLIDYQDPALRSRRTRPANGPADGSAIGPAIGPVPPARGAEYEFRLLSLKVAFANTAVRSFSSYAQLTTTTWFDMPIVKMGDGGNPYGAIVLEGTLQTNSGQPVYSLASTADTTFYFANDAVAKLEITDAVMSTRNSGSADDVVSGPKHEISSWFALSGFLDFKTLRGMETADRSVGESAGESAHGARTDEEFDFDVFSFGSDPAEQDKPRTGLAFSNLGILMTYPQEDPAAVLLAFAPDEIRFDVSTSTARPGSLFRQFALEVSGLVSGDRANPPLRSGFTAAVTPAQLAGVAGGAWWGIDYRLPLGTPGNLAGRTGLTAHMITAWSPARSRGRGGYRAMVGVRLPGPDGGAKLVSLQNVLKLSVGQIWLQYDHAQDAFLLLFSEIALRVFGLLSLPPGSTLFNLYGAPGPAAGAAIDPTPGPTAGPTSDPISGPSDAPGNGAAPSGLGWYAMYRRNGSDS